VKLRRVRRFTQKNIKKITVRIVTRGARVVADGLGCFNGVADAGCTHEPIATVSGRKATRHPAFKAIDTCSATSRAPSLPRFDPGQEASLAEFEYRSNRCYDLAAMTPRHDVPPRLGRCANGANAVSFAEVGGGLWVIWWSFE
jgi:hypothetical protein